MMNKKSGLCAALMGVAGLAVSVSAQDFSFTDVSAQAGIGIGFTPAMGMNSGVAAADYDGDGDIDLFVCQGWGVRSQLLRNNGDGTFTDIALGVGITHTTHDRIALWADVDGDGDLDLVITGDCFMQSQNSCVSQRTWWVYLQQNDGTFTAVLNHGFGGGQADIIVNTAVHRAGLTMADFNNDGYLDVYAAAWHGDQKIYFYDPDDARYHDVTNGSNLGGDGTNWQPIAFDYNGDNLIDIFQAVDFGPNKMFVNNGDGSFNLLGAETGLMNHPWNNMGVAFGDYDRDGRFDMYVTEVTKNLGDPLFETRCILYHNLSSDGTILFEEIGKQLGVHDAYWGWGCTFLDADNDARLDLAMTNGIDMEEKWLFDPSRFFHQNAGGTFDDVSDAVGFNDTLWGSTVIGFDYDRDGDLDMAQTAMGNDANPPAMRLLRNDLGAAAATNKWFVVQPRQPGTTNFYAVGATVEVITGTINLGYVRQARAMITGMSQHGQEPYEAHFGTANRGIATIVIVKWPDGTWNARYAIPTKQIYVFNKPLEQCPGDFNGDGDVDKDDVLALREMIKAGHPLADFNGDGVVNLGEWNLWKPFVQQALQNGCN
jgi:hypothetical protein